MMADYIRRDLAQERFSKRLMWLKKDVHDEYSGALLDGCETDIELLDEIPAADVAEVVLPPEERTLDFPAEVGLNLAKELVKKHKGKLEADHA